MREGEDVGVGGVWAVGVGVLACGAWMREVNCWLDRRFGESRMRERWAYASLLQDCFRCRGGWP